MARSKTKLSRSEKIRSNVKILSVAEKHRGFGISVAVWREHGRCVESPTQHDIFHLRAICLCRWSPTGSIPLFPRCCTTQGGSFVTAFERSARVQGGAGGTRLGALGSSTLAEIQASLAPSETDVQYCLRILPEATPKIMRNPPCKWKRDNLGECRSGFSGSWVGAERKLQD